MSILRQLVEIPAQLALFQNRLDGLRFLMPGLPYHTTTTLKWEGRRVYSRREDWFAVREVFLGHVYDFAVQSLQGIAAPRVLDIGANIGCFAMKVLHSAAGAHVLSVEPGHSAFSVLARNRDQWNLSGWQLERAAVWTSAGTAALRSGAHSTASCLEQFVGQRRELSSSEEVPTVTMPMLMARFRALSPNDDQSVQIDLMKMDIEGAECAVLGDGVEWLAHITRLLIELHPDRGDTNAAMLTLKRNFPFVYRVANSVSSKPLLFCSREELRNAHVVRI